MRMGEKLEGEEEEGKRVAPAGLKPMTMQCVSHRTHHHPPLYAGK